MHLKLLTAFFVSFTCCVIAQVNPGARQAALSNSDIALSDDVFSLFYNPAGLSQINWREAGVYYSPSPFGLSELANGFAAYNEPLPFGSAAIGGMTYGFDLYRENKITAGYSYNYNNKFFIGGAVNYHTVSIKNYGSDAAFYFNIGGLVYIADFLRWGFYFHNINRATFSAEENQIPVILGSGLSYDVLENISFNISVIKDLDRKASLNGGIEYNLNEYLSIRSGFSNEPSKFSAGIGIKYSLINFDYAMFTHQDLGLTHQAGIIIRFDSEKN